MGATLGLTLTALAAGPAVRMAPQVRPFALGFAAGRNAAPIRFGPTATDANRLPFKPYWPPPPTSDPGSGYLKPLQYPIRPIQMLPKLDPVLLPNPDLFHNLASVRPPLNQSALHPPMSLHRVMTNGVPPPPRTILPIIPFLQFDTNGCVRPLR